MSSDAAATSANSAGETRESSSGFVDHKRGKIITEILERQAAGKPFYSFEFFPPKTDAGVVNLYKRIDRMALLHPLFVDVTFGAGGSTSSLSLEICAAAQNYTSAETMLHLTCTNMPRAEIEKALDAAREAGIRNILALRGDPPKGADQWEAVEGGFSYAVDLVRFIRERYGDYFGIAVAGYPEGHITADSLEADVQHLKEKVEAGADFIITQLFYSCDKFFSWVRMCRDAGISVPIVPGIMPIQNYPGFKRMTGFCKTFVPDEITAALEPIKHDDAAVKAYGIELCAEMCRKLLDGGAPGLHMYTLNLARSVEQTLARLGFVELVDEDKRLPWKPSVLAHRAEEAVRPIFWKHRPESYLSRTTTWDEFPNGRWGDHRSPAFGDLRDYHLCSFRTGKAAERLALWGAEHADLASVYDVFTRYVNGEVSRLPWCENPVQLETLQLRERLAAVNAAGFLTINSQPRVNGAPSDDEAVGWGGPGGVVYQKAYLEFFTSPANFRKLEAALAARPGVTYHAVNQAGEQHSNVPSKSVNAVTWGVWPAREVQQPTVVDAVSFMVWKDEAFGLWREQWLALYPAGSRSHEVVKEAHDTFFLVNVVDNDFIKGDIFSVFDSLL